MVVVNLFGVCWKIGSVVPLLYLPTYVRCQSHCPNPKYLVGKDIKIKGRNKYINLRCGAKIGIVCPLVT